VKARKMAAKPAFSHARTQPLFQPTEEVLWIGLSRPTHGKNLWAGKPAGMGGLVGRGGIWLSDTAEVRADTSACWPILMCLHSDRPRSNFRFQGT